MPKLKRLSGRDVVAIFAGFGFGFEQFSQRGSTPSSGACSRMGRARPSSLPAHSELDSGTSAAIYRQALRYIPESELKRHFYSP
jgi:hypothetical protein